MRSTGRKTGTSQFRKFKIFRGTGGVCFVRMLSGSITTRCSQNSGWLLSLPGWRNTNLVRSVPCLQQNFSQGTN